jgi:hypothetical protein
MSFKKSTLEQYMQAAWDSGYYAATLEKVQMDAPTRAEYEGLLDVSIARRKALRETLEEQLGEGETNAV